MHRIVGIDPGIGGACALFCPGRTTASGLRWVVMDMPVVGDPACLNAAALRDWLREFAPDHAYLERVNAMPSIPGPNGERRGMGATSAFRFGGMFFAIQAVLSCCDVPFTLVSPVTWKKWHGLKGPNKEASRQLALRLFPDQADTLRRKKDENRAEAMLLTSYGAAATRIADRLVAGIPGKAVATAVD